MTGQPPCTKGHGPWFFICDTPRRQAAGPQALTRRPQGRRIAPSFLVLQSKEARPASCGAFYLWYAGRRAAGPQDTLIMITGRGPQALPHQFSVLEPRTLATGYPLRGHQTPVTALK
jgi:hypothetical protein